MKLEGGRGRAVTRVASDAGWRNGSNAKRHDPPRASHRGSRESRTDDHDDGARHRNLSARENEVFHMLVDGLAVNEVAHALHLSGRTVESHVAHILHKLALGDSAELIGYAVRHGLIDEGGEGVV
ncbi:Response regulator UvrY [Pandoraea captiosa]|uniref:Response regulator UvrY n=1 Tax=Pandoraea captiosa TaxID=2508302 RepID=A0A5E5A835_9BURK|nr:LuxR C-terminal-related transcriptional regulator [Pandoraea captiosa]VVE68280.1 Response regulator UvrY [Pandoraea captiosa]